MVNQKDVEIQTDILEVAHVGVNTALTESATDDVDVADVGVNTEVVNHDCLLEVDVNGMIHPRSENEKLVEMKINHDFKSWEEVESLIRGKLKMTLIGRPWLSNSGKLFKTVGFRTLKDDYERWKMQTFNWQDSGIRAVSFSRLYR